MAHFRKLLPCVRYFSRAVLQCERQTVSKSYMKACLNHGLLYIPAQNFTVAAETPQNQLKMALQNCSFWDVMTLADKKRDVYVFGMDYTVTQEQIESFFSGLDMEEIYTIEPSRARIKKFYYIRFKDEENKKRALLKDKEILGNRYLEVHGIENPRLFGRSMLFQNTLNVRLTNLPFNVKKTEIIEWLEVEVSEEDIFFVKRGECVVCLPDKAASALVVQKNKSLQCIGERKIHVIPFVTKDDLGKLDICCKEEIQQEV